MVFEKLSPDEVCVYLKQEIPTVAEDILENLVKHKIDGEVKVFRGVSLSYGHTDCKLICIILICCTVLWIIANRHS